VVHLPAAIIEPDCSRVVNALVSSDFRRGYIRPSGITFLVMQRSLAFSLGNGDPSVNRDPEFNGAMVR
jgi:hypothetical protein